MFNKVVIRHALRPLKEINAYVYFIERGVEKMLTPVVRFWVVGFFFFALKGSPVHTNRWRRFSSLAQRQSRLLYPRSAVSCRWTGARQAAVGRRGAFAHLNEHICPFTPTSQFMRFWTSCLHPCMAFGDKWLSMNMVLSYKLLGYFSIKTREGKKKKKQKNNNNIWPWGLGRGEKKKKKHFHAGRVQRCLIRTTSSLLCVLGTGLLMSLRAYCMCKFQYVGSWGWGKLQDRFLCYAACAADL